MYGGPRAPPAQLKTIEEALIKPATKYAKAVMPDVIRHPAPAWIPASAGMTKPDTINCRSNNRPQGENEIGIDGRCIDPISLALFS